MKSLFKTATCIFITVAICFGAITCNTAKPIDKTQLAGYWKLTTLDGESAEDVFKGSVPGLNFDFEKNTIYGNSGCNAYTGGFTLDEKNMFSATKLVGTMMMCIDENKEPQFLKALSGEGMTIVLDKNVLSFINGDRPVLVFIKNETPKVEKEEDGVKLVNVETLSGEWILKTIAGGDVAELFKGKPATINFSEDVVNGNGGCNSYRGTYKLDMNTITFGPLMSTKMACSSLEGENKFTQILASPVQATINGNVLIFNQNGNTVLEFAKVR